MRFSGAVILAAVLLGGCAGPDTHQVVPAAPTPTTASAAAGLGNVEVPSQPLASEVARFWFTRPGPNRVGVGPRGPTGDSLVVQGACFSHTGHLTWTVFDNSDDVGDDDLVVLDRGTLTCDGTIHRGHAHIGRHQEVAVLAVTGTADEADEGENGWVAVTNV